MVAWDGSVIPDHSAHLFIIAVLFVMRFALSMMRAAFFRRG